MEETSGEHLGALYLGALWEASGMVLGIIWESFGNHLDSQETPRWTQSTQEATGGHGLKK